MRGPFKILLYLFVAVLLTGVYFGSNYLGLYLKLHYYDIAPLWPAAGVSVALLWLYGLGWWPVILLGEVLSMHFLGLPWERSLGGAVAQLSESLLAAYLLRKAVVDPM